MTPQEQLCEKMRQEQNKYYDWLTAQPPEEILRHAYEYSVREDIILATEEMNLTPAQELICKGWFLPPNTYDCGSFVVN